MKLIDRLGITGTHVGGTAAQLHTLDGFIGAVSPKWFHHGDCIGVDIQGAAIARRKGARIVNHPPVNSKRRGFFPGDEVRPEAPYLVRDHQMVDEVEMLIGVPETEHEMLRSGTWATIRYAVKRNKPVHLILPRGELILYHGVL